MSGNERCQPASSDRAGSTHQWLPAAHRLWPNQPNTGHMHHDFVIGAENSRFVDLKISKAYLRQWTTEDWQTLGNFLHRLGRELYADIHQVSEEDEHEYVFSFWWD